MHDRMLPWEAVGRGSDGVGWSDGGVVGWWGGSQASFGIREREREFECGKTTRRLRMTHDKAGPSFYRQVVDVGSRCIRWIEARHVELETTGVRRGSNVPGEVQCRGCTVRYGTVR